MFANIYKDDLPSGALPKANDGGSAKVSSLVIASSRGHKTMNTIASNL